MGNEHLDFHTIDSPGDFLAYWGSNNVIRDEEQPTTL